MLLLLARFLPLPGGNYLYFCLLSRSDVFDVAVAARGLCIERGWCFVKVFFKVGKRAPARKKNINNCFAEA